MRLYERNILGSAAWVKVVESDADAVSFRAWVDAHGRKPVAVDTETTGLDDRAEGWRLRMVQFGDTCTGWVIPAERKADVQYALDRCVLPIFHNRPFDASALTRAGFTHHAWDGGRDTHILAHLVDSRSARDGGVGHGLKALADHYIYPGLSDDQTALKDWAKANKMPVGRVFAEAPQEVLEAYAGMDVLLTARLFPILLGEVCDLGCADLEMFELQVQRVCAAMVDTGFKVDLEYAEALDAHLEAEGGRAAGRLAGYGVDNPNSPAQVVTALEAAGVVWADRTAAGKRSVDSAALAKIAHPIAALMVEYRTASKLRKSYVEAVLTSHSGGRVHASIRALQARTGRMSVSSPPLQQLPSNDALIRRMFIPDDGYVLCAADYSQIELRVLAALADEPKMIEAIQSGVDLHTNAADKMRVDRRIAKMTNFLTVYGGGAAKLEVSAGIGAGQARAAVNGFNRAFPRIKRYGEGLQRAAYNSGDFSVTTMSNRRLVLDRDRMYAATNYVVQSSARDVLAEAMLRIDESYLGGTLLLPVHDELLFQVPKGEETKAVADMVELMETTIGSKLYGTVPLAADGSVYGSSWGHGYPAPSALAGWF